MQMLDFSNIDVNGCWDSNNFDYAGVDSTGRSGGLISIWDTTCFQKSEVIKNRHFLIVSGKCKNFESNLNTINVYGAQSSSEKKKVWSELLKIINDRAGMWVVFGDFNVVRNAGERCNSHFCPYSAREFNCFIQSANLKDFTMGGEKFTFMSRADAKLSKLDKFLVCPKFLSSFPLSVVTAFPRELSDHSPITLTSTESDFGPIPFKLFNSWLLMDGFDQIVKDTWDQFVGYGSPDAYLAAKLRYLKDSIKRWRRVASLTEKKVYNDTMSVVNNLVKIAETRPLSTAELDVWNTGPNLLTHSSSQSQ
ncbi:uncharacterized protein LOC111881445 [Lactuca sativa]|uniref:uncharacterized protein LOC111881445 n=1 Tax=Lactuca sativa TaxID=4236 RepID=UPI000CD93819|nr:uncharacterized protein LOC111881445 [Lactuca sativa]